MANNLFGYILTKPYRYAFALVLSFLAHIAWEGGYSNIWTWNMLARIALPIAIVVFIDVYTLLSRKLRKKKG